eukprot:scaffold4621_cov128-Isochrysis_galbana.AAC.11
MANANGLLAAIVGCCGVDLHLLAGAVGFKFEWLKAERLQPPSSSSVLSLSPQPLVAGGVHNALASRASGKGDAEMLYSCGLRTAAGAENTLWERGRGRNFCGAHSWAYHMRKERMWRPKPRPTCDVRKN